MSSLFIAYKATPIFSATAFTFSQSFLKLHNPVPKILIKYNSFNNITLVSSYDSYLQHGPLSSLPPTITVVISSNNFFAVSQPNSFIE